MPRQRFAPEGALLGGKNPTTLTSGGDTPLHAEVSRGRGRGGNVKQRARPWSKWHNHTQGGDTSGRNLVARGAARACSQLQSSSWRTAGRAVQREEEVARPRF